MPTPRQASAAKASLRATLESHELFLGLIFGIRRGSGYVVHLLHLTARSSCHELRGVISECSREFEAVSVACLPAFSGVTDGGAFDGSTIFSVTCSHADPFHCVSVCSRPTLSSVAVMRDAFASSSLLGAVIMFKAVSSTGTATTSSIHFQRLPVKLNDGPIGYTAGGLVVMYAGLCDHGVPPVMSPVMQATRFRAVHVWANVFLEPLLS